MKLKEKVNYFSSYGQRNHIPLGRYGGTGQGPEDRIGSGGGNGMKRGNMNSNSISNVKQLGGEYGGLVNTSVDENYKSPDALKLLKRGK